MSVRGLASLVKKSFFSACVLGLAMQCGSVAAQAGNQFQLVPVTDGMQLVAPDGKVIFRYVTTKPENIGLTSSSAAFFDPINTPSGERVTNVAPNDHPHHRGMFLGWIDSEFHRDMSNAPPPPTRPGNPNPNNPGPTVPIIPDSPYAPKNFRLERADFWSWGFFAPRDGRVIKNKSIALTKSDAQSAELKIENVWSIDGKDMMNETDIVNAAERDGVFVIDVAYHLQPVGGEFILNQRAFGGFAVQGQKYGDHYYANPSGKVSYSAPNAFIPELDWPSEPWYDYTIKLQSDGKTVGFAVIDHPLNPPTRWHNTVWFLNPCITTYGPITIHPDAPLVLRYRVVVHDGDTPTDELQKLAVEFRRVTPSQTGGQ